MQYMLLIYGDERGWEELPPAKREQRLTRYRELGSRPEVLAANGLQPTASATTVRVRDGDVTLADGPFAETQEQLGGFYLVEADTLDGALAIAREIPAAADGSVEVRPVGP